jgi:hypothetical protein
MLFLGEYEIGEQRTTHRHALRRCDALRVTNHASHETHTVAAHHRLTINH